MKHPIPAPLPANFNQLDQPIVVFDLDNCLANDAWRMVHINWARTDPDERYATYHSLCHRDEHANKRVFDGVTRFARPVFLTARPESVRQATELWIFDHFGIFQPLVMMRREGDHRPSVELKREMITLLPSKPMMAFDDRNDVCAMYASMGIVAIQMAIHDVCAMTPPPKSQKSPPAPPPAATPAFLGHKLYVSGDPMPLSVSEAICDRTTGRVTLPMCRVCGMGEPCTERPCPGPEPMPDAPPSRGEAKTPTPRKSAPGTADALEAMAATFRERQKVYGSNYKMIGPLMAIMFPSGVPVDLLRHDAFHLFELVLVKLSRLAVSCLTHEDSAHDAGVYCAMIETIMKEKK